MRIFGGVGYSPSHPSRWAGAGGFGTARLELVGEWIVLTPVWPFRRLVRMPVLRIPLREVHGVSRISFGIKFSVPADPALDGTRFKRWHGQGAKLEALVESLQRRGIAVETMPRSQRVKGFVEDFAVTQRPGWIWRDRGRLGFLEDVISLAIVFAVLFAMGFFSDLPTVMFAWLAFILAVIVWARSQATAGGRDSCVHEFNHHLKDRRGGGARLG